MRIALVAPFILAIALVGSASAQVAQGPEKPAPTVQTAASSATAAVAQVRAQPQNDDAAAALALTIRHRQEQEQRIARLACAAGDAGKCADVKPDTATPGPQ